MSPNENYLSVCLKIQFKSITMKTTLKISISLFSITKNPKHMKRNNKDKFFKKKLTEAKDQTARQDGQEKASSTFKNGFLMKTFSVIIMFCIIHPVFAQNFTQIIKGKVIDKLTQTTLPGASVLVMSGEQQFGVISDEQGYYKLTGIGTGRISISVSYLGYFPVTYNNLYLSSGKELVVDFEMEEQVIKTEEAVVIAKKDKTVLNNDMILLSGRTFTIEESQRFAGARNDVGRMASNYAGVSTANDAVNDIVIRGNSPNGLLWRLEGIEIPNPNHFGDMGVTGGPVSMLNNNVLSNSDFITSAFPAEYGNALSGAFDLKMRNGNYEKHEFIGQVGFNGFEFGAEGPLSKKSRASYLINARYSTLEAMSEMGINFGTGTAIPKYSDLTFKVHIPTKSIGIIDIFGLGGINSIDFINSTKDSTDLSESMYDDGHYDVYIKNDMAVIGINHTFLFNANTYSKLSLAFTRISNHAMVDSIGLGNSTVDVYGEKYVNYDVIANYFVSKKFNAKNNIKIGFEAIQKNFNLIDSSYIADEDRFRNTLKEQDKTYLLSAYMQWQYKPINNITINTGIHYQQLTLNDNYSIEPRIGIKWYFLPKQSLSFGYGLHSKILPIYNYFNKVEIAPNQYVELNRNLDFIKSQHFVIGYDWSISPTLRVKVESYYQQILQAVVATKPSSFSMLNSSSFSWDILDSLKNGGNGQNFGLELTIEKFLDKGFYFLFTGSLFDSKYRGSDNILRSTAFDSKYVVNLLCGKEFEILRKENSNYRKWLTFDGKATIAGGQKYTPIDLEKSRIEKSSEYIDNLAFSEKYKDYFRADIRFSFKLEGKKTSQEWAFDIQNFSNHKNPLYQEYNSDTDEIETVYQLGIFPMVQYKITF
jgi:hypothetical protein